MRTPSPAPAAPTTRASAGDVGTKPSAAAAAGAKKPAAITEAKRPAAVTEAKKPSAATEAARPAAVTDATRPAAATEAMSRKSAFELPSSQEVAVEAGAAVHTQSATTAVNSPGVQGTGGGAAVNVDSYSTREKHVQQQQLGSEAVGAQLEARDASQELGKQEQQAGGFGFACLQQLQLERHDGSGQAEQQQKQVQQQQQEDPVRSSTRLAGGSVGSEDAIGAAVGHAPVAAGIDAAAIGAAAVTGIAPPAAPGQAAVVEEARENLRAAIQALGGKLSLSGVGKHLPKQLKQCRLVGNMT
jgi:hypothetical protein